ncbi:HAMP domain-containing protein [Thalassospira sp. MA62]|nr:HAMP domain-containing protein [Thalassospira sp. MA62]
MTLKTWSDFSLATKFAIGNAAMALSVMLLTGAYAASILYDQFSRDVIDELELESVFGAHQVATKLSEENTRLANMAKASLVTNGIIDSFGREKYLLPFLNDMSKSANSLSNIGLYDFEGQVIAQSSREMPRSIAAEGFLETVRNNRPAMSMVAEDDGELTEHLLLAYPIFYNATLTVEGVLVSFLHLEYLPSLVLPHMPHESYLRLVDENGSQIGSWRWPPNEDLITASAPVLLSAPMNKLYLYFEVGRSKQAVFEPIISLIWHIALVNIALIFVVAIAAMMFGWQISRPLRRLDRIAQSVTEQGEFDVEIPPLGRDEVGRLSDSFRQMLGFISVANRVLETRVSERTRELDDARGQLRDNLNLMESILHNVVDGIITVDFSGRIESCNRAASNILKCSGYLLAGRNIADVLELDSFDDLLSELGQDSDAKTSKARETVLTSTEGPPVFLEFAIGDRMIINQCEMVTFLIRDISQRKEVERLKQEFVAAVSHELRTPLTSISGALSLVKRDQAVKDSQKLQTLLAMAEVNAKHLGELVDDILDLEKLEGGQMKFANVELDIIDLVRKSIENSTTYLQKHGKVARLLCAPDVRYIVNVDELRMSQVMNNLLSNAAKYSVGSDIDVVIACVGDSIRISVIDQGNGIPPQMRKNMFTRFWQADGSNTRRVGGTGLGLVITQALVEGNGGTIGYRSRKGVGSIFYLNLPCLRFENNNDTAVTPAGPARFHVLAYGPASVAGPLFKTAAENGILHLPGLQLIALQNRARAILYLESRAFEKMIINDADAINAICSGEKPDSQQTDVTKSSERSLERFPLVWMSGQNDATEH